jgi:hypothetical protein
MDTVDSGIRPADQRFDLWSLDEGRTLGEFPDLVTALVAVRQACLEVPAELVLSREAGGRREPIAIGPEVLTLAAVPGGPWTEDRFLTVRHQAAREAVRLASAAFVTSGGSFAARQRLEIASRRWRKIAPSEDEGAGDPS